MTYDTLQTSQCNNCNAGDDMSNYWVPQLYIHKQVRYLWIFVKSLPDGMSNELSFCSTE